MLYQLASSLSDQEKYEFLRGEGKHSKFTTIKVKKKGREVSLTFQSSWLQEFDWLTYSPSQEGGFCKYCVQFGQISKGYLGILVKKPFKNFSRAK